MDSSPISAQVNSDFNILSLQIYQKDLCEQSERCQLCFLQVPVEAMTDPYQFVFRLGFNCLSVTTGVTALLHLHFVWLKTCLPYLYLLFLFAEFLKIICLDLGFCLQSSWQNDP